MDLDSREEIEAHNSYETRGYCSRCKGYHSLSPGKTLHLGQQLMTRLKNNGHINLFSDVEENQNYSTSSLFGDDRGKMFGVLEGVDSDGNERILYAFSGQYNGLWNVPGWAPPLFDEESWQSTNHDREKQIKAFGKDLTFLTKGSEEYQALKKKRKSLSQQLMKDIHALYVLQNMRGESSALQPFFPQNRGIPTGTGDCCAPKLLNHAIRNNILPMGMAEFYWGKTNKSGSKRHGCFYPACREKCSPLLGFLLCGIELYKVPRN